MLLGRADEDRKRRYRSGEQLADGGIRSNATPLLGMKVSRANRMRPDVPVSAVVVLI